jgi:hypothetical protein
MAWYRCLPGIALALLTACALPPWRSKPPEDAAHPSVADTPEARRAQCKDLRTQIAWYEKARRTPPLTSSPEIAAAAAGKNDNKIDELRQRYDALGCDGTH